MADTVNRSSAARFPMGACIAGLILVPIKLLYTFLPIANVVDAVVFFVVGLVLGRRRERPHIAALCLSIPSFLLCLYFAVRVGPTALGARVGVGWLISMVVIPGATFLGVYAKRP